MKNHILSRRETKLGEKVQCCFCFYWELVTVTTQPRIEYSFQNQLWFVKLPMNCFRGKWRGEKLDQQSDPSLPNHKGQEWVHMRKFDGEGLWRSRIFLPVWKRRMCLCTEKILWAPRSESEDQVSDQTEMKIKTAEKQPVKHYQLWRRAEQKKTANVGKHAYLLGFTNQWFPGKMKPLLLWLKAASKILDERSLNTSQRGPAWRKGNKHAQI